MTSPSTSRSASPAMNEPLLGPLITDVVDAAALADYLQNADRARPAVIVSARSGEPRYGVEPAAITQRLKDRAEIFVLDNAAVAWALDSYPALRTYGGAVRVVGAAGRGTVVRTDREPGTALNRIVDEVTAVGRGMVARRPAGTTQLPSCTVTPLDLVRRRRGAAPEQIADGGEVEDSAVFEETASALVAADTAAGESDQMADLRRELEETWGLAKDMDAELAAEREVRARAEREIARLRTQIQELGVTVDQLRADACDIALRLFSNPEEQFRDEVQRTWLRTVPEADRGTWALRDYQVGPDFLDSLDLPNTSRAKIVEVAVDVLTRRAYEMPSRSVHAHGDGGPAGTNAQIRRGDGATGYRANIRSNTPQAPRLLWWELTDGSVELVLAARHDDPFPR
ncbi:MAG: hypothetical protein QG597_3509 [Actinomycetota bacterium]|nr:hypothetical protein [Actinomycetota bacterium]